MEKGERTKHGRIRVDRWKIYAFVLAVYDFAVVIISYFLALWFRFDCIFSDIPLHFLQPFKSFIVFYAIGCIPVFIAVKMYRGMWRYSSFRELGQVILGSIITWILHVVLITAICGRMPFSYYVWGGGFQTFFLIFPRFFSRFIRYTRSVFSHESHETADRVMIVGAGKAGQLILRDMRTAREVNDRAVCFIDDDSNTWGRLIDGVPIAGGRDSIFENVRKYHVNKIFFAIPTASVEDRKEITNLCEATGCEVKVLPGMYQLILGQVSVSDLRDVSVEDLLGREAIKADMNAVYEFVNDKVVLVTGGGGSIGSELCRQVAAHKPRQLIIFEVYENNAFEIGLELRQKFPDLNLEVLIGSVRDSRRVFEVFSTYRPQIVYHAAAHKHVPLMEDSPCEAIKNNAMGTYKTAYAAMVHGCERFVLISTDKAVNPTNIMGASKRLCEMIIQSFDEKIKMGKADQIPELFTHDGMENADKDGTGSIFRNIHTEFVAVRFGNVLGSNGSVIPIFKKQIAAGGPVTVTHPDIIRYFMTIPEAVSLVMLAGTYAKGGEIFVLDMGSPVKIDTLARNLIHLCGYKPDVDIKIVYSGLRPGEKLYEEKLMAEEGLKRTENNLIHIGCPIPFDVDDFLSRLRTLMYAAYSNRKDIRERVMELVSTYHPQNTGKQKVNEKAEAC